ncbi:MAG: CoA transferase [Pseudomonadota bacterium]
MSCFEGVRVLELGSTIAGPFAARLMADFGADVVKVEPPEGDAVRAMGAHAKGVSLYAASLMRGKSIVALDLRRAEARAAVRRIAATMDVVIENFRPGTLERWDLGYETLSKENRGLILARVSGYGQDGPYCKRPGYGVNGEAMSGLRDLTGDPDRPPPRVATSLTDYIAGTYTAFGIAAALYHRCATGYGQVIDTALTEAAMSYVEPHIPAYDATGVAATRAGSRLAGASPNALFPTRDGHIHIAAFSQSAFARLAAAMDAPELVGDPKFKTAAARNAHVDALEAVIGAWSARWEGAALEDHLVAAGVPASRIFGIADLFTDPHMAARNALVRSPHPVLGTLAVAGIVPKLSATPGKVGRLGGAIGVDSRATLERLGFSAQEIAALGSDPAPRKDAAHV